MKKAYIASPIFNADQLAVVKDITMKLTMLEYEYFSPYEASREVWAGRAPKDCTQEERDKVLKGNIDNLHWAELLVAWVGGSADGRTDTGVTWEMGYFNALTDYRKTTNAGEGFTLAFVHTEDVRQSMNLMLAGTVDAVAYGPAQLYRALDHLAHGNLAATRKLFHPSKVVKQEAEAIS